jgi:predicted enzyme related to lactoylglutathione lyase
VTGECSPCSTVACSDTTGCARRSARKRYARVFAARVTEGDRYTVDWTLEVVILPVSDIDRSIEFYRDQVGFELDHDTRTAQVRVVQLTPRGSGCSIVFGDLPSQREMAPGSMRGLQLVVADAQVARQELLDRGVDCSEITVLDSRDGGTFFGFSDPDGNTWAVQQLMVRAEKPLIPVEYRGRFGA